MMNHEIDLPPPESDQADRKRLMSDNAVSALMPMPGEFAADVEALKAQRLRVIETNAEIIKQLWDFARGHIDHLDPSSIQGAFVASPDELNSAQGHKALEEWGRFFTVSIRDVLNLTEDVERNRFRSASDLEIIADMTTELVETAEYALAG